MRDRRRLGMAMAAMIRMIATTINSSMSEKPLRFLVPILWDMFSPSSTVALLQVESRSRHNFWHFFYWLLPDYKRLTGIFRIPSSYQPPPANAAVFQYGPGAPDPNSHSAANPWCESPKRRTRGK